MGPVLATVLAIAMVEEVIEVASVLILFPGEEAVIAADLAEELEELEVLTEIEEDSEYIPGVDPGVDPADDSGDDPRVTFIQSGAFLASPIKQQDMTLSYVDSLMNSELPSKGSIYWQIHSQTVQDTDRIDLIGIKFFDDLISGSLSPNAFRAANMSYLQVLLSSESAFDEVLHTDAILNPVERHSPIFATAMYASSLQTFQHKVIAIEWNVPCKEQQYVNLLKPLPATESYIKIQSELLDDVINGKTDHVILLTAVAAREKILADVYEKIHKEMKDSCYKKWVEHKSIQSRENSNRLWNSIDDYVKWKLFDIDDKWVEWLRGQEGLILSMFKDFKSTLDPRRFNKNQSLESIQQVINTRVEKKNNDKEKEEQKDKVRKVINDMFKETDGETSKQQKESKVRPTAAAIKMKLLEKFIQKF